MSGSNAPDIEFLRFHPSCICSVCSKRTLNIYISNRCVSPQSAEVELRRMQGCIHFMNLKKLNRLAHMRLKRGRDQTHEVILPQIYNGVNDRQNKLSCTILCILKKNADASSLCADH